MRSGLLVGVVGVSLLAAANVEAAPRKEAWLADYAAAREVARGSGKPLLVVFR
jgi:hypothetical protein